MGQKTFQVITVIAYFYFPWYLSPIDWLGTIGSGIWWAVKAPFRLLVWGFLEAFEITSESSQQIFKSILPVEAVDKLSGLRDDQLPYLMWFLSPIIYIWNTYIQSYLGWFWTIFYGNYFL